jgi:hypothetical protein
VHEHIEPANVLAAGEVVKLRSDCIRDVPDGTDEAELKARDVHDLAVLLLQALTQRRQLRSDAVPLPAPFEEIVRNGISGVWGLPQIAAALAPSAWQRPNPVRPAVPAKPVEARVPTPAPVREVVPVPSAPPRGIEEQVEERPRRTGLLIAGGVALLVMLLIGLHYLRGPASQPNPSRQQTSGTVGVPAVARAAGRRCIAKQRRITSGEKTERHRS